MQKPALYTAGVIFELVAVVHLVRYVLGVEVIVGGAVLPVFPSLPVGIALLLLGAWMVVAGWRS